MNKLDITKIISSKKSCFFISPHFDDALLSAGELIRFLSAKTKCTVITVFSDSGKPPYTMSARKNIKQAGFTSPENLYFQRNNENQKALAHLNCRGISLGFTEALFRKINHPNKLNKYLNQIIPEAGHVYPTYRWHISSGKVSDKDRILISHIAGELKILIPREDIIFSPYGIGNHVDHMVTREAIEENFHPIYWADQPYLYRLNKDVKGVAGNQQVYSWPVDMHKKRQYLKDYASQIPGLFAHGHIPVLNEYFII